MEMKKSWLRPLVGGGESSDHPMLEAEGGHGRFSLPVVAAGERPLHTSAGKTYEVSDYQWELGERVLSVLERRRPYLKTSFSIGDLAELMMVPKYHLYHCFKHVLKTRFVELRTECRVEHAKRRLLEADLGLTRSRPSDGSAASERGRTSIGPLICSSTPFKASNFPTRPMNTKKVTGEIDR